jgi:hypothetical protein
MDRLRSELEHDDDGIVIILGPGAYFLEIQF